jgi:hypothetical protein
MTNAPCTFVFGLSSFVMTCFYIMCKYQPYASAISLPCLAER